MGPRVPLPEVNHIETELAAVRTKIQAYLEELGV